MHEKSSCNVPSCWGFIKCVKEFSLVLSHFNDFGFKIFLLTMSFIMDKLQATCAGTLNVLNSEWWWCHSNCVSEEQNSFQRQTWAVVAWIPGKFQLLVLQLTCISFGRECVRVPMKYILICQTLDCKESRRFNLNKSRAQLKKGGLLLFQVEEE